MYQFQKPEARWLTLRAETDSDPAVEVLFAPHSKKLKRKAILAAREAVPDLPDTLAEADIGQLEAFSEALARETLRGAILDWRGIGDADGNPVPVTPETIEAFLADEDLLEAADIAYLVPAARRDAEKNGSSPSPNGTSTGAPAIVPAAPSPSGAKSARTPSKPRKPRKAKTSGTS